MAFSYLFLIGYLLQLGIYAETVLSSCWILGQFMCWVGGYSFFLLYKPSLGTYDFLRPVLFNFFLLTVWGINLLYLNRRKKTLLSNLKLVVVKNELLFWGSLVILMTYVLSGGASTDKSIGPLASLNFSSFYFVQAFLFIHLLLSLVAGYFWGVNKYNILFLFICLVNFLGDHRGVIIVNILMYLAGIILNRQTQWRTKSLVGLTLLLLGVGSYYYLGNKRIDTNSVVPNSADDQIFFAIQRVTESSGQLVVDYAHQYQNFRYFENFERILTMPLPSFLVPNKQSNDDHREVLEERYNYVFHDDITSIPLTYLADCYGRMGTIGVILFTVIIGCFFMLLNQYLLIAPNSFKSALLVLTMVYAFRLYPASVLGTFAFFFYELVKFYILIRLLNAKFIIR
ncbi:MAG: hypothetical protein AAF806_08380 [Bacteroidota bacterium]